MKLIILIGDGMGDRPIPELKGKTPLETAKTPNMDLLAKRSECGLMDPLGPGIRAGSDTAHLAILGYDPYKVYTGRGPFEAGGIGMDVREGDISFRCNFATVDEKRIILDRRAGRIKERTDELSTALNGMKLEDVICYFKESTAHRAALILRGKNLGNKVTDIDPHKTGVVPQRALSLDQESKKTAEVLNEFVEKSYQLLNNHPVNKERRSKGKLPANIILPRGGGLAPALERFRDKYNLKSACIVEVGLIKGIGRYLGMDIIDVPQATGGLDTDTLAIGKALIKSLGNYDFILCNVKGPDVAGHDGNYQAKVESIEKIDLMVGYILKNLPSQVCLSLTADHSTPVSVKDHSGDPVPILFSGPTVRVDEVDKFSERAVTKGGLGRIRGLDVMNILTNLGNLSEKFGA